MEGRGQEEAKWREGERRKRNGGRETEEGRCRKRKGEREMEGRWRNRDGGMGERENGEEGKIWRRRVTRKGRERYERDERIEMEGKSERGQDKREEKWRETHGDRQRNDRQE